MPRPRPWRRGGPPRQRRRRPAIGRPGGWWAQGRDPVALKKGLAPALAGRLQSFHTLSAGRFLDAVSRMANRRNASHCRKTLHTCCFRQKRPGRGWVVGIVMQNNGLPWIIGAIAIGIVTVLAFSAADSGARTLTASVVNDADAYLAIEANAASPNAGFVSVSGGKTVVTFNGANSAAAGTGINPESTYMFDSILKITNKGT